ncbi:MAG: hypothetical protein AAF385_11515 [Pseudomonadota bacterium]
MPHGREVCGFHWYQLPPLLRRALQQAGQKNLTDIRMAVDRCVAYFEERMIGEHVIARCTKKDAAGNHCAADIVWLKTWNGKSIPLQADTVSAEDELYDSKKHTTHFNLCEGAK